MMSKRSSLVTKLKLQRALAFPLRPEGLKGVVPSDWTGFADDMHQAASA